MRKQVGNVALMQKMNRLKVLNLVRMQPDISRPGISEQTGLALSSVTNITSYLLEHNLLWENGTNQAVGAGRRSTRLRFKEEAYGLIIASFDEREARVFYTDLGGNVLDSIRIPISAGTPRKTVGLLEEQIAGLLCRYGREKTLAAGVIFSGLVLDGSHFVISASMKWKENDIRSLLEKSTGLPVFVENISRPKAVWYANSENVRDRTSLLFVDLENGIGSVQMKEGRINHSFLGEIGHTTVAEDGEVCFCGNRGCLEAMCSPARIRRVYQAFSEGKECSLEEISEKYEQKEEAAVKAVEECAQYLGIGLANLIMLTHPAVLVLNNRDFSECRRVVSKAMEVCRKRAHPSLTKQLDVREIAVSEEDAVKGAAAEMCDWIFALDSPYNPVE